VDTSVFYPEDRTAARRALGLPLDRTLVVFGAAAARPVKHFALAEEAMRSLPNAQLVELRGYTRDQVRLLFSAADAMLLTSRTEGSPQVVKEALACECPVVSTDVGDVARLLEGAAGCAVTPHDAGAIAARLADVLASGERPRSAPALAALRIEVVAARLLELYGRVLSGSGAPFGTLAT
jgi:teichuronic acid biosynthesis glycosyltransferase TuaC